MLYLGHRVGGQQGAHPREFTVVRSSVQTDQRGRNGCSSCAGRSSGFEDSQCFTLSAGQHQRVSPARLLLSKARLWVLDEPFTTLDVRGVAFLENLIGQHSDRGGSVLVTTHHALAVDGLTELTLGVGQMPRGSLSWCSALNLAGAVVATLRRDLLIAYKRKNDLFNPFMFFVLVATLFPMEFHRSLRRLERSRRVCCGFRRCLLLCWRWTICSVRTSKMAPSNCSCSSPPALFSGAGEEYRPLVSQWVAHCAGVAADCLHAEFS